MTERSCPNGHLIYDDEAFFCSRCGKSLITTTTQSVIEEVNVGLNPEAEQYFRQHTISQYRQHYSKEWKVRLTILVWGPSKTNQTYARVYKKREEIRDKLRDRGHAAFFSEEWRKDDPTIPESVHELFQARSVDLIFMLPESPGALAEALLYSGRPELEQKVLIFANAAHRTGFASDALWTAAPWGACREYNDPEDIDACRLVEWTLERVTHALAHRIISGADE